LSSEKRGFIITKHDPVVPAKLSNVTDVGGIPSHNGLRHLASSHIDVIVCARVIICLKLKWSHKHLGDPVLIIFLEDPLFNSQMQP
jgi:hypothetical protein